MTPYWTSHDGRHVLYHGDCLEVLPLLPPGTVDAVVTDPPYGLSFMGKKWDYDVPAVAIWEAALAACKPGAHLLAFAGTRTQHRMACRIEDAAWEIRDMIAWVYGSGFPKSLNVSKAIDKAAGAEREVVGPGAVVCEYLRRGEPCQGHGDAGKSQSGPAIHAPATAPATAPARQWNGYGTALKPALEPLTMARKPLSGTVAANVLEHGTGALNIDGCRVAASGESNPSLARRAAAAKSGKCGADMHSANRVKHGLPAFNKDVARFVEGNPGEALGRWPANLIHDGSPEVLAMFAGTEKLARPGERNEGHDDFEPGGSDTTYSGGWKSHSRSRVERHFDDDGSAARFFYTPKASKADRGEDNNHATVKPSDLMAYLVRMVCPPGGLVLDPFAGSGTTGLGCIREGARSILIERDAAYLPIIVARMEAELAQPMLIAPEAPKETQGELI